MKCRRGNTTDSTTILGNQLVRMSVLLATVLSVFSAAVFAQESADEARRRILAVVEKVSAGGPFRPDWKSLEQFHPPAWYVDGKFGVFIHWGAYSVPAFGNEWYPRNMYVPTSREFKHHVEAFGSQERFGYKDFIPLFRAERFDARHWAEVLRDAGVRFVVPVAEHHDGFPMYSSSLTDWCAAKMGPKRDVIGELSREVRRLGMVFGVSSHRAEHWWFFGPGMDFESDVRDPKNFGLYGPARDRKRAESGEDPPDAAFLDDWLARCAELVERYQPQLIWFDWWIAQPAFHTRMQKFAAFYYNRGAQWNRGVAINYKKHGGESFPDKAAVLDIERGQLAAIRPFFWQTDTSVSRNSWGYVASQDYKTVDSIVDDMIDIVSKNGALLLNIGPKPDGTIPEPEEQMLLEIGRWLKVNGEAIYGTRPWKVFGEGPTQVFEGSFGDTKRKPFTGADIRFTARGSTVYAVALAWPETGWLNVRSFARGSVGRAIGSVSLLGSGETLEWTQNDDGLRVRFPPTRPCEHAFALRINTK